MMIAEFIGIDDIRWMDFLSRCSHDFYHLPGYMKLCSEYEGGEPFAFYGQAEGVEILIPLLKRLIPTYLGVENAYDATSPYGYPTPLILSLGNQENNLVAIHELLRRFIDTCGVQHIVSVFIRLHPVLELPLEILKEYGTLLLHGPTIAVDLTLSADKLMSQIRKDHSQDIRSLYKNGYIVRYNQWDIDYPIFIRMYYETMQRLYANDIYFFSEDYFDRLKKLLEDKLEIGVAINANGEIVGGALFTFFGDLVQYHLSATADAHVKVASMKLILSEMIQRAKLKDYKVFHLGGGLGSRRDLLYSFKA